MTQPVALIVGAGHGLSAAIARACLQSGMKTALAARNTAKLADFAAATGAQLFPCDAAAPQSVEALFTDVVRQLGSPELVVFNASYRTRGPFLELDPAEVAKTLEVSAFAGFLVARQAALRMVPRASGTILFTGASASVKGYAQSAPFAMGKFALRGLAQSMARELAPKGIHVAHFVIDGAIRRADGTRPSRGADSQLAPEAIAEAYLFAHRQPRSAWTWEIELRPWDEPF
jgi:NAD(P)-dependent dehydrogenase (short-subunit alcohol dehydrogenase family)